mmetsp:Transcript_81603/g.206100  ORF Transcript_81603/g.206100 Transcript_81603/m.206100 type:complete len:225 (-) Transcript_81603:688-1362(-)
MAAGRENCAITCYQRDALGIRQANRSIIWIMLLSLAGSCQKIVRLFLGLPEHVAGRRIQGVHDVFQSSHQPFSYECLFGFLWKHWRKWIVTQGQGHEKLAVGSQLSHPWVLACTHRHLLLPQEGPIRDSMSTDDALSLDQWNSSPAIGIVEDPIWAQGTARSTAHRIVSRRGRACSPEKLASRGKPPDAATCATEEECAIARTGGGKVPDGLIKLILPQEITIR